MIGESVRGEFEEVIGDEEKEEAEGCPTDREGRECVVAEGELPEKLP